MRYTVRSFLILAIVLAAVPAFAYESRFEIDPAVRSRLPEIARRKITLTSSSRAGDLFRVDASAALSRVDATKLLAAATDYDHYVQFGMPHLNESRVVERASPDLFYVFSAMSFFTIRSSQYMEVRAHRSLSPAGAAGIEWEMTPRRAAWPPANSSFGRMDGSFYLEPLADGSVYVRYYLVNQVNIPLSGLLSGLVQSNLRAGAADVIMALARQAAFQR